MSQSTLDYLKKSLRNAKSRRNGEYVKNCLARIGSELGADLMKLMGRRDGIQSIVDAGFAWELERLLHLPDKTFEFVLASPESVDYRDLTKLSLDGECQYVPDRTSLDEPNEGVRYRLLKDIPWGMGVYILQAEIDGFKPGGNRRETRLHKHAGIEWVYVQEGSVSVDFKVMGLQRHLGEGGSMLFNSSYPHRYINEDFAPAKFISVRIARPGTEYSENIHQTSLKEVDIARWERLDAGRDMEVFDRIQFFSSLIRRGVTDTKKFARTAIAERFNQVYEQFGYDADTVKSQTFCLTSAPQVSTFINAIEDAVDKRVIAAKDTRLRRPVTRDHLRLICHAFGFEPYQFFSSFTPPVRVGALQQVKRGDPDNDLIAIDETLVPARTPKNGKQMVPPAPAYRTPKRRLAGFDVDPIFVSFSSKDQAVLRHQHCGLEILMPTRGRFELDMNYEAEDDDPDRCSLGVGDIAILDSGIKHGIRAVGFESKNPAEFVGLRVREPDPDAPDARR